MKIAGFNFFSVFMVIIGMVLIVAPKKYLELISKYYDTRNFYGDRLGKKMGTIDMKGNLVTAPYPWVFRLLGCFFIVFGGWLFCQ